MTVDSIQVAAWLLALFSVAGGTNQVLRLVDRMKEQPAPGETYATKTEVREHKQKMERDHTSLANRIVHVEETLRREQKEDTALIYNKLNSVAETVSAMVKSDEIQGQQLAAMDSKLTKLLNRASSSLP